MVRGPPQAATLPPQGWGPSGSWTSLRRQILHSTLDIGRPKTDWARETLKAPNPDVTVVPCRTTITPDNVFEIIKDIQIVVNGCDIFPIRRLIDYEGSCAGVTYGS